MAVGLLMVLAIVSLVVVKESNGGTEAIDG